jgi:recombination protein RecA
MVSIPTSFAKLKSGDVGRGLQGFRGPVAAELQPCGVAELDAVLGGGFPRGSLVELCGPATSGRTGLAFSLLAQATARQEACAFVDVSDSLDPASLAAAGVDLARLLWVRCGETQNKKPAAESPFFDSPEEKEHAQKFVQEASGKTIQGQFWKHPREQIRGVESAIPSLLHIKPEGRESARIHVVKKFIEKKQAEKRQEPLRRDNSSQEKSLQRTEFFQPAAMRNRMTAAKPWKRLEQALKTTDLLLHSGGWGVVVVDLADISWVDARRINMSVWFRFRRELENTKTILLLLGEESCAKSCASLVLRCERKEESWSRAARDSALGASILQGFAVQGEILRSRSQSQPSDCARWQTQTMIR